MSKTSKILTAFLVFAFLCVSVTPAFAWWWSSSSRSSNYYESSSTTLDQARQTPKYQPQAQPSLWQRVSTNVGNFFRNVGNFFSSAFNGIKNVFTNVVDFTKSIFTKVGNFFTGTKDDTQIAKSTGGMDSALDKPVGSTISEEGLEDKLGTPEIEKQTTEEYFASMESGQSIFEPTEPEQVSGRDVEEVIQEIREGDKELGYAGVPESPSEIQPPHEIAIDDKSKITDVTPKLQEPIAQSPELIAHSLDKEIIPITPLQTTEPNSGIMPGESWEKVKPQMVTEPSPMDKKQIHEFQTYQDLTKAEKRFVKNPLNIRETYLFHKAKVKAFNKAQELYPDSLHNGKGDTFRHAYWSSLMVKHGGAEKAKIFADAHEARPGIPLEEKTMDLYNNKVGRQIGLQYGKEKTDGELAVIVQEAIEQGRLRWLK